MTARCAFLLGLSLFGCLSAQDAGKTELPPSKGFDLESMALGLQELEPEIKEGKEGKKIQSLSSLAPKWLGGLVEKLIEEHAEKSQLRQMVSAALGLLAEAENQELEDTLGALSLKLLQDLGKLEGSWQEQGKPPLALLAALETTYHVLASLEIPRRRLAPYPWRDALAMMLRSSEGLSTRQLEELFDYLEKLPARADKLHFRTAILALRSDPDDKLASRVLRHLSARLLDREQVGRSLLCMEEALRRQVGPRKCADWISLGSAYARTGLAAKAEACLREATRLRQGAAQNLDRQLTGLQELCTASRTYLKLAKPEGQEDKIRLCKVLSKLGHPRRAFVQYRDLYRDGARDPRILLGMGLLGMELGSWRRARTYLAMATDLLKQEEVQEKEKRTHRSADYYELQVQLHLPELIHALIRVVTRDDAASFRAVAAELHTLATAIRGLRQSGRQGLHLILAILELLEEFAPAIEKQDEALALRIFATMLPKVIRLQNSEPQNPTIRRMLHVMSIVSEDRKLARSVLLEPIPEEDAWRQDHVLTRLRAHAFFKLGAMKGFPAFEEQLQQLLAPLPEDSLDGDMLLGTVHAIRARQTGDTKRLEQAAERFAKARSRAKAGTEGLGQALNNLGMVRVMQGRKQEALDLLQQAKEQDPTAAKIAGFNLLVLEAEPDIRELQKIQERRPQDKVLSLLESPLRTWRAWLQHQAGQDDAARQQACKVLDRRQEPSVRSAFGFSGPGFCSTGEVSWGLATSTKNPVILSAVYQLTPWLIHPAPLSEQMLRDLAGK